MDKVLPVIIVCGVGIAAAIAYIVFVVVSECAHRRKGGKPRNEFEIDEDTLTVKLSKRNKGK